ncbi:unnamed protein product [Zymoseptoria tritici ST99CH_1E4]|uniref:DUF7707 domain-containing protein n=1 Tax=Zymoseptoria tritici ST99CH_1E4 TaxID=1276532 RepID=A0A2H1GCF3_ZYMTR|nr:unnamed protein product [Zymoseptoria tritici ST99CH_1E4]
MKTSTTATLTTLLFATAINAQDQYAINPTTVNETVRDFWCTQQQAQCPLICLQEVTNDDATTQSNDCNPTILTYACVCSDGTSPNISEYSQTLPFFICQEWGNQCVANCGGNDATCQTACREQHPCGAQNPKKANSRNSTSTATATEGSTSTMAAGGMKTTDASGATRAVYTQALGAGPTSSKGSGGNGGNTSGAVRFRGWALGAGQTFGGLALAGAFFGGFAVLL